MFSSSLAHTLERVRARFGLEVEILDANLQHLYPEAATALTRMIDESAGVRQSLREALAGGRSEQVENGRGKFDVFPLRRAGRNAQAFALVVVRRMESAAVSPTDQKAWSELARAVVEADFAATEALSDAQQHSRRLMATLRFLRHLVETDDEQMLGQAILQASAVWFDVDARIFQRDLSGEYRLHAALPGADIEESPRRLNAEWVHGTPVARLGHLAEWGDAASGGETMLVALSVSAVPDWVLALTGTFPPDAESLLAVLGRVVGAQLETIHARQRDAIREHFESLAAQAGAAPEAVPVRLVRELMEMAGAAEGSLVLNRGGHARRLVSVGDTRDAAAHTSGAAGHWQFTPGEFTCPMPLGEGIHARLSLRPKADESMSPNAALVTRAAARVLQCWLVGAEPSLPDLAVEPATPLRAEFLRRIEEELQRARQLDLGLSLILIGIHGSLPQTDAASMVQQTLRGELRGSDVLGQISADHVAALLTHTDPSSLQKVVGRLRRRLGDAAAGLMASGVTLGHAVFSPECRTGEALLLRAARDAQPVSA